MGLYQRLRGEGGASTHIDPAHFIAALKENIIDQLTVEQIDAAFVFDENESNEWQTLVNLMNGDPVILDPDDALDAILLSHGHLAYDSVTLLKARLGVS